MQFIVGKTANCYCLLPTKYEKIAGVTIVRGIAGYGVSGQIHTSSLLSLSLELPLVIEFYDEPQKVARAIETLRQRLDLKHIVSWPATAHIYNQES